MALFTGDYAHHPAYLSVLHIALFGNVTNAAELRARLIQAATLEGAEGDIARDAVNFAFVDARLITSLNHLRTAISQAVLAETQGSLRTKTVHSEILWALNPGHNISDAIRRYGVSDTSSAVIVIRLCGSDIPASEIDARMRAVINGTALPLSDIPQHTDWKAVKKYHKLNAEPAIMAAASNPVLERTVIDTVVTSNVAMKGVSQ